MVSELLLERKFIVGKERIQSQMTILPVIRSLITGTSLALLA